MDIINQEAEGQIKSTDKSDYSEPHTHLVEAQQGDTIWYKALSVCLCSKVEEKDGNYTQ